MTQTIYNLRHVELDPSLAAKLFPFTNAYRPHDPIQNWRELRDSGLDKVEEDSVMDVIRDQYEAELDC
jgi:hypothetical protein